MLRFAPQYRIAPWGGRRLAELLGHELPEGKVGESWELVDRGEQQSRVEDGPRAGQLLGELWRSGALGGSGAGRFPFLLKWLSPDDRLSVQVHPDAAACARLGTGEPKSEAWCVVAAEPGASLAVGHYPGLDEATLRQAALGGTLHKWLYELTPRVGDLYLVPAGTLHTLSGGLLLLEVQEPSDTTFRLYDWGRVGLDGAPRELHLEQACVAVSYKRHGPPKAQRTEVVGPSFAARVVREGVTLDGSSLRVLVAHAGPSELRSSAGSEHLDLGDVVVAEPADGSIGIIGGSCLWLTEPLSSPG
jgi:mannose-6-phosphate isomerase